MDSRTASWPGIGLSVPRQYLGAELTFLYRSAVVMNNKNFSSVFSMRSQGIVGSIWASVALVAAALPIVCHTMGYQASQVANKVMTAGPIEDALEYLLWLLRNA